MLEAFYAIFAVIGGCLTYVTILHFSQKGYGMIFGITEDEVADSNVDAKFQAEFYKQLLRNCASLLLFVPLVSYALQLFDKSTNWILLSTLFFAAVPFVHTATKKSVKKQLSEKTT